MSLAAHLRGAVLPFAVVFYPQLWFLNREVGIAVATTDRPVSSIHQQAIGSAGVALVVSLLAAIAVVGALRRTRVARGGRLRVLLRPSNGSVATFAGLSLVFWAFVVLHSPSTLPPGWSDVVGLLFAWPLLVLHVAMVLLGNAFFGEPAMVVQSLVVGVGVALSAVWLFLVSRWVAALVVPGDPGVDPP